MLKKIFTLAFVIICLSSYSQEYMNWSFNVRFKIASLDKDYQLYYFSNNKIDSIEFFINESEDFNKGKNRELKYDTATKEYTMNLKYGEQAHRSEFRCPDIFIKVNFSNKSAGKTNRTPYSKLIPIYFDTTIGGHQYDLGTIDLHKMINYQFTFLLHVSQDGVSKIIIPSDFPARPIFNLIKLSPR